MMIKRPATPRENKTIILLAYPEDLKQIYAFYCSRYENISYKDFLNLGTSEFFMKLGSIPESEPLYTIIKSRTINLAKIKDKNERKYWRNLKEINKIPNIYLSVREINDILKGKVKNVNKVF